MNDETHLVIPFKNGTKLEVSFPAPFKKAMRATVEVAMRFIDPDVLILCAAWLIPSENRSHGSGRPRSSDAWALGRLPCGRWPQPARTNGGQNVVGLIHTADLHPTLAAAHPDKVTALPHGKPLLGSESGKMNCGVKPSQSPAPARGHEHMNALLKLGWVFWLTAAVSAFGQREELTDEQKAKAAELAKELQNPVATLVSVPLQHNFDFGFGPEESMRYTLNVQPSLPVALSKNWSLITRSAVPVIYQESMVKGGADLAGLGDVSQSFFFSPRMKTRRGWIWGFGPAVLWPTATREVFGAEKFAAGPTAAAVQQQGGWTYGMIATHLWSYEGDLRRDEIESTLFSPFVSYTTRKFTSFGLSAEGSYDWEHSQWTTPVVANVSQLVRLHKQPMQLALGFKYYAEKPRNGPEWALRFTVTFLFPDKAPSISRE